MGVIFNLHFFIDLIFGVKKIQSAKPEQFNLV